MSCEAGVVIATRAFTMELDAVTRDPDTGDCAPITLTGATAVSIRLISPKPSSVVADVAATLPGSPTNRVRLVSDGTHVTTAGTWTAIALYTLSGVPHESLPWSFEARAPSPTPP